MDYLHWLLRLRVSGCSAPEADVFVDATVVACFLGQVLIVFFKLNEVSVTDCLSLYLSMRISMSFLCASNFFLYGLDSALSF